MNPRALFLAITAVVAVLFAIIGAANSFHYVDLGEYHITQSTFSNNVEAHMTQGPYAQLWSRATEFPVSETFFFTADKQEGDNFDQSIQVQFNDGSACAISGTCRVDMPKDSKSAMDLLALHGYKTMRDIHSRLILPTIRRGLTLTANQMSAKESYAEKRAQFVADAWDQILNGVFVMRDDVKQVLDPVSGKTVTVPVKVPVVDKNGVRLRERNPLDGLGITLSQFEVKSFIYEDKVKNQIAAQQQAIMDVQTAKANALKAEQDAITTQKLGEAAVMKAKYEEETKKARAEVAAQQEAAVAAIKAQQQVEVAKKDQERAIVAANQTLEVSKIELEAAKAEKQRQIELGTGESERRRMNVEADGGLPIKLDAYVKVQTEWAAAFAKRLVPQIVGGGGNGQQDNLSFMDLMAAKAAKDLLVETSIRPATAAHVK